MGKFKVGDRVRCIDSEGTTCVAFGAEYEVESFGGSFVYLKGCAGGMYASRFTHVTPTITIEPGKHYRLRNGKVTGRVSTGDIGFEALVDGQMKVFDKAGGAVFGGEDIVEAWVPKVGERVLMRKGSDWYCSDSSTTGTLVEPSLGSTAQCAAIFEGDDFKWHLSFDDLEPLLVAAPAQPAVLKIEAGRYYKTRDGRKVGPLRDDGCGLFGAGGFNCKEWYENGRCYTDLSRTTPKDLIAEWVDDPVVAVANDNGILSGLIGKSFTAKVSTPKSKFKVGDRVRSTHGSGRTAVVTDVVDPDNFSVRWEDGGFGSIHGWTARELELVTSQPAIVALIEDGQPKPAERPHVHASVESATVEAERLAGLHRGQRFGVYVLHDTRETDQPDYGHEWKNLAARGQKIAAIKELRSLTGLNLSAAKTAVEKWAEHELAA